jgi:hypothetical protein
VADVNGLAGVKEQQLDEHLTEAAEIGRLLGFTPDELAERLRRVLRNLDKK